MLAVLLAGCGGTAAAHPAHRPTPALSGLAAQTAITECAAAIEAGTADGRDYTGLGAHSPQLPAPCRPLDLHQLTQAARMALQDMLNQ